MPMSDYYARKAYDKCQELARDLGRLNDAQKASDRRTTEAFNRMAAAIEGLTEEVRKLREEINPKSLDKPKFPGLERGA